MPGSLASLCMIPRACWGGGFSCHAHCTTSLRHLKYIAYIDHQKNKSQTTELCNTEKPDWVHLPQHSEAAESGTERRCKDPVAAACCDLHLMLPAAWPCSLPQQTPISYPQPFSLKVARPLWFPQEVHPSSLLLGPGEQKNRCWESLLPPVQNASWL